jgi:hypothetical protein
MHAYNPNDVSEREVVTTPTHQTETIYFKDGSKIISSVARNVDGGISAETKEEGRQARLQELRKKHGRA